MRELNISSNKPAAVPHYSYWQRWRKVALRTAKLMIDMDTSMRCAGVAYFGFLSLFPAIATVVLLVGLLADRAMLADIIDRTTGILPDVAIDLLRAQLQSLLNQPQAALGLGLLFSVSLALWSGSRGMNALLFAASRARREPDKRSFLMSVVISVAITLVGSVCLVIALTLVAAIPAYFSHFPGISNDERLLLFLRWPVLLILAILAIAALYAYGPDRRPKRARWIWPGAVLAAVLWLAACLIFSVYVENFSNFEVSFGPLTAAVVLLLWMYNSALVVVLGAVLNAELEYETLAQKARYRQALKDFDEKAATAAEAGVTHSPRVHREAPSSGGNEGS